MFHLQIPRALASSNIYSALACLCARSLITLILFTSLCRSPHCFIYTLCLFLDFKAYPWRRTRPPCPSVPAHTHTHARTKGSRPNHPPTHLVIFDSLSEYVKRSSSSSGRVNAEKLPELSGPLTGLPCGQMGRGCVWRTPPPRPPSPLWFPWLFVDNQQGGGDALGRALAIGFVGLGRALHKAILKG